MIIFFEDNPCTMPLAAFRVLPWKCTLQIYYTSVNAQFWLYFFPIRLNFMINFIEFKRYPHQFLFSNLKLKYVSCSVFTCADRPHHRLVSYSKKDIDLQIHIQHTQKLLILHCSRRYDNVVLRQQRAGHSIEIEQTQCTQLTRVLLKSNCNMSNCYCVKMTTISGTHSSTYSNVNQIFLFVSI